LCSLVSKKKKPESGAYLVMKNKSTAASFLFTSDDRPMGREGARSNFEPQHRQVSTHHRSGLLPLAAGDLAGARREFEATKLAKIPRPPYLMYQWWL
jgi:hypothetical protein